MHAVSIVYDTSADETACRRPRKMLPKAPGSLPRDSRHAEVPAQSPCSLLRSKIRAVNAQMKTPPLARPRTVSRMAGAAVCGASSVRPRAPGSP